MKLPGGCGEKSEKTAKLERAMYGLKQSVRGRSFVCGYSEQCKADPCIFRKNVDEVVVMIIGVYVDDLLVGGSQEDCKSLLLSLNKKFPTNNVREFTWYNGCGIERDAELDTIKLSHEAYVEILMARFDVRTTSDTPAAPGADLGPKREDESGGDWPVREVFGSLCGYRP